MADGKRFVNRNTVKVKDAETGKNVATLFWGDPVKVVDEDGANTVIEIMRRDRRTKKWTTGRGVVPSKHLTDRCDVLKVRFIDVGQGDGAIIETPAGKLILVDGGETENFIGYFMVAFRHLMGDGPLDCDAVLVTHGDADHFEGLTTLLERRHRDGSPVISPRRVFHNGLVKRADPPEEKDAFGATGTAADGGTCCTELLDDFVADAVPNPNGPFKRFAAALKGLRDDGAEFPVERLEYGRDDAFADLARDEKVSIKVLGPITEEVDGRPALRFLKKPGSSTSLSASHTVNGHSVVLKLTYGNVRFLFGADLNEESEERLLEVAHRDGVSLAAEVLKVPHHGSHEFNPRVLEAIRPVVSIVSSGDESVAKEYIHPRSVLMGALGKYSRQSVEKPLVFVTEMVAFFDQAGELFRKVSADGETDRFEKLDGVFVKTSGGQFVPAHRLYEKSQFGIVHVRTDGKKVLVITHSGKDAMKEQYTFRVDSHGEVEFEEVRA